MNHNKIKLSIVFGAGGFIGSHLINKLINNRFEVWAVSRLKTMPKHIRSSKHLHWTSWSDIEDQVKDICEISENISIFHLAANIDYQNSIDNPEKFIEMNLQLTFNIIRMLRELNFIGKMVYLSSDRVFGKKEGTIDEKEYPAPIDNYGLSKFISEEILKSFSYNNNNQLIIVRCANVYGSFQKSLQLLPSIFSQLSSGKEKISVGNLDNSRSYIYIDDLITALVDLINYKLTNNYEYFHFSNPPQKLNKLTNIISSLALERFNKKIDFIQEKSLIRPNKSEIGNFILSTKKAKKQIGWNSNYSLEAGIEQILIKEQIFNAG